MKRCLLAMAFAVALGTAARAQEITFSDPVLCFTDAGPDEWAPKALGPEFGIRAGYFKTRDADDGEWFGGVQVRLPLGERFAIEGSVDIHASEFEDGAIEVLQYPLQGSLLFFLLPQSSPLAPYLLAGVGWYYTVVDFTGTLSGFDGDTSHWFGGHVGFGAKMKVGDSLSVNADLRYIFLEPDGDALEDEDFDTLQVSLGLSFGF